MMQSSSSTEFQEWQRQLVMRCNNRAWSLSVQSRTPAEDREMLDAAHTSAYHWAQVGSELNRLRATMLLAEVHALLGHGATALSFATEMRDYFLGNSETPDWEIAFTHAIYAHCAYTAGNFEHYRAAHKEATAALAAIAADDDRQIVLKKFRQVPAP